MFSSLHSLHQMHVEYYSLLALFQAYAGRISCTACFVSSTLHRNSHKISTLQNNKEYCSKSHESSIKVRMPSLFDRVANPAKGKMSSSMWFHNT